MQPREQDRIRQTLLESGLSIPDPGGAVERILEVLRRGGGEEPLVRLLAELGSGGGDGPSKLVRAARSLLRIGIVPRERGWRKKQVGTAPCTICEGTPDFCWSCRCGFRICQSCLEENRWGMTCNNITWECPDCGGMRSF